MQLTSEPVQRSVPFMRDPTTRLDTPDSGNLTENVGFPDALLERDDVSAGLRALDGLDPDSGSRPGEDGREDGGDGAEESEELHCEIKIRSVWGK